MERARDTTRMLEKYEREWKTESGKTDENFCERERDGMNDGSSLPSFQFYSSVFRHATQTSLSYITGYGRWVGKTTKFLKKEERAGWRIIFLLPFFHSSPPSHLFNSICPSFQCPDLWWSLLHIIILLCLESCTKHSISWSVQEQVEFERENETFPSLDGKHSSVSSLCHIQRIEIKGREKREWKERSGIPLHLGR